MLRSASTAVCVTLFLSLSAYAPHAAARELDPVSLSEDAECWYGELYGITGINCRDDGKLYRCRVARTECWFAIPPGPYTFTRGGGFNAAASPAAAAQRR